MIYPRHFAHSICVFCSWMLYLLHLVEGTTNDYFCTSLQLAVAILQLSPNVSELPQNDYKM